MKDSRVRIVMGGPGGFRFEVNGQHVPGVRRFSFESGLPGKVPIVTVELIAAGGVELEAARAVVAESKP